MAVMRWLDRVRIAVRMLLRRDQEKQRLSSEMLFHLEQLIAENVRRGLSPEGARLDALKAFGNRSVVEEQTHSQWSWNWLEGIGRDLRYGARTLTRTPGFSVTAIVVMALGIGATTSLFTIVRSVLLRPLPFRDPDKLVMLYEQFRNTKSPYNEASPADFIDWHEQTHGFQDIAAWRWWAGQISNDGREFPEVVGGAAGSSNFFAVLGVHPVIGRTFTADEDRPGAENVVMLSWSLFQSRYAGDRSIVGRQIRVDSRPATVVGVLPKQFSYPGPDVKVWIPYGSAFTPEEWRQHDIHQTHVIARLRTEKSGDAAVKEVSALQYQIHMQNQGLLVADDVVARPLIEDVVDEVKTPLIVLMGAVGCMLLIACLNLSNLLVARAAARRREIAIRGALGASRWKLIQEQVTESLAICAVGGAVGATLSVVVTQWLGAHWRNLPRADDIHSDSAVIAFSVAIVIVTSLLAGLAPAISSTGKGLLVSLHEWSRTVRGSTARASVRKLLLTGEIALTVVLLTTAGLLFRSFINLRTSDLGCTSENILTMRYGLPEKQYDRPEKVVAFHEALVERVRALPGVEAAGLVSTAPAAGHGYDSVFTIPEHPSQGKMLEQDALTRQADPEFFVALHIPVLSGTTFTNLDRFRRTLHVIISKKFAEQFFPGENPLGRHVRVGFQGQKEETYEIIGVVGDTLHDIGQPMKATIYRPILDGDPHMDSLATLVVRTAGDPTNLSNTVEKQIPAIDPELPARHVLTLQQIVERATASQSFSASLVLAFATLSLVLAAVGLYGVLSFLVTQRSSEIGIRMALGAQRSEVVRLVLADGIRPVFLGLMLGIGGGAATSMMIKSILFGTGSLDPMVFAVMIGSLLITAVIASAVPALRACRIEPVQALRLE
ncbi:MAG TPA: ABC transporter permease [Candidatus Angelobacter sp.]|nr:ABC transporter permease [Candidatus Angelobacter sp.]